MVAEGWRRVTDLQGSADAGPGGDCLYRADGGFCGNRFRTADGCAARGGRQRAFAAGQHDAAGAGVARRRTAVSSDGGQYPVARWQGCAAERRRIHRVSGRGCRMRQLLPVTFVFNGGPGMASAWLQIGAVSVAEAVPSGDGWAVGGWGFGAQHRYVAGFHRPAFIDPPGTGYSPVLTTDAMRGNIVVGRRRYRCFGRNGSPLARSQ